MVREIRVKSAEGDSSNRTKRCRAFQGGQDQSTSNAVER